MDSNIFDEVEVNNLLNIADILYKRKREKYRSKWVHDFFYEPVEIRKIPQTRNIRVVLYNI